MKRTTPLSPTLHEKTLTSEYWCVPAISMEFWKLQYRYKKSGSFFYPCSVEESWEFSKNLPVSSGLVQLVKIWKNNRKSVNRFKVYWWILLWNDSWVQKKGTACKRRNRYEYQGHCTSVQHRDRKNIEMGKYCIFCLCDGWSKIIQVLYKKILYLRFTLLMTND